MKALFIGVISGVGIMVPLILGILWYFGIITRGGERRKYSIPQNHERITWKPEVNKYGLEGDNAKKVILNKFNGREIPHSEHFVKAYRENFNSPVWDQTDGKNVPGEKPSFKVETGKLEWEE